MSSTIVKKALEVCTTRFDQSLEEPEQQQTQVNNVKKIKNQGKKRKGIKKQNAEKRFTNSKKDTLSLLNREIEKEAAKKNQTLNLNVQILKSRPVSKSKEKILEDLNQKLSQKNSRSTLIRKKKEKSRAPQLTMDMGLFTM